MKLIFAVDAIFPPLTGIGRYAAELARGLVASGEFESLRFYLHGRWVELPPTGSQPDRADGSAARQPALARLRSLLAGNPMAVRAYATLAPRVAQWRLRTSQDHIFHSPNFVLPPFPGVGIATVHDLSTMLYPELHPAPRVALMAQALPATLQHAQHIITPSLAVREQLLQHCGIAPERITATPLGVDPAYVPMTAQALEPVLGHWGLRPGGYTLCIATLEPRKNLDGLLDAWAQLPAAQRQRYPLVLAGAPGWGSERLLQRIQYLQRHGEVRHLGYVAESRLPALYAGARLFAFPALYEGFGLPVLEAMACGIPVVTSNSSSLPEVAGGAALLVAPEDTTALAQALQRGLEDEPWREQATAMGLQRAQQATWARCVSQTMAVYRREAAKA